MKDSCEHGEIKDYIETHKGGCSIMCPKFHKHDCTQYPGLKKKLNRWSGLYVLPRPEECYRDYGGKWLKWFGWYFKWLRLERLDNE